MFPVLPLIVITAAVLAVGVVRIINVGLSVGLILGRSVVVDRSDAVLRRGLRQRVVVVVRVIVRPPRIKSDFENNPDIVHKMTKVTMPPVIMIMVPIRVPIGRALGKDVVARNACGVARIVGLRQPLVAARALGRRVAASGSIRHEV